MELECLSCYFYPNGMYQTKSKWNNVLQAYDNEPVVWSRSIRIFGTQEEIDEALNKYCSESGLNLDEAYDFTDKDKLKEYKKHYKNTGLIINIQ